jgi:hypothetical protein
MFQGTTGLPAAPLVWHSFAPLKFKLHAWLALRQRCWTANHRLHRGLPSHVLCPLCGGADETIDHITMHCGFARGIWAGLVGRLHLPDITPTAVLGIYDWWLQASRKFCARERKEANSVIMLVMRSLWLERNARVFDDKRTSAASWLPCRGGTWREIDKGVLSLWLRPWSALLAAVL